jgi:predicted ATP-binding protein involved in virulence
MTPFRISKLEVNEIGPFGNLILDFPEKSDTAQNKAEIHILTGENGTGKSTILEILTGTLSDVSIGGVPRSVIDKKRSRDKSRFSVTFSNSYDIRFYCNDTIESFMSAFNHHELEKYRAFKHDWRITQYATAFFAYSGYRRVAQTSVKIIQEIETHPFQNALDFHNSIQPQLILQWLANTISKGAIAKSQNDEKSSTRYKNAITQIEKAIEGIIEKPVSIHLELEPMVVKIQVDGEILDFNLLPDGLKSIISWLSDLLMRMDRVKWENDTPVFERNFILFLDEIEVHLHPAWQRKILPAVQSLFPNAQIFVSTHSPFVVGSIDGAWIHKLVKPNGDTKLASAPILSEDSRSVSYWLKEVFDVKEEFGQAAQQDLDKFYNLRNALLAHGTPEQRADFKNITNALLNQNSQELETIIGFELRQLNKRLAEPIQL